MHLEPPQFRLYNHEGLVKIEFPVRRLDGNV